ncbi:MAG: site-specific DNA-methyltransferase [Bdellovibrionales bacterium]|nr:site-specific DNA-methyltransferase [Bdellovibrionales bacterium]
MSTKHKHKNKTKKTFPKDFINKFLCGDAVQILKKIPNESLDLAITSPPYNIKNSTGNGLKDGRGGKWASAALIEGYATYNDNMPHKKYVKWQREVLTEIMRILKPTGAFFYNHKWRVQAGLIQDRQDIVQGFPVRQIIIWQRAGGINFNKGYFLPTYEVIYMIAKRGFKLAPKANAVGDIWTFPQEMNNKHPAAFPIALIDRIISSTTAKTVIDPFMGSGTTALSAKKLKIDFIGIDIAKEYCKLAKERLKNFKKTGRDPFQETKKSNKKIKVQLHSDTLPLFQDADL